MSVDMHRVRIAVVGAGLIGRKHAMLVGRSESCDLAGVCDIDPTRRSVAEEAQTVFYEDIEALLERERPDGAVIAVPNALHGVCADLCARRSVHVLIEKPIADSLEEARRIEKSAFDGGISVLVGHHRRYNPLVRTARSMVRNGAVGRLLGVSVLWALCKPEEYFSTDWRRERPGGGPTLINLIHDLDTLRHICGEIGLVNALSSSNARKLDVEDTVGVTLSFDNGAIGTVMASDAAAAPWSYEICSAENPYYFHAEENCYHFLGTDGSLAFPRMELWRYADKRHTGWRHPLKRSVVSVEPADPLEIQLEHFRRVIRGVEKPQIDSCDATRSLAVALAVLESARTGAPVRPSV